MAAHQFHSPYSQWPHRPFVPLQGSQEWAHRPMVSLSPSRSTLTGRAVLQDHRYTKICDLAVDHMRVTTKARKCRKLSLGLMLKLAVKLQGPNKCNAHIDGKLLKCSFLKLALQLLQLVHHFPHVVIRKARLLLVLFQLLLDVFDFLLLVLV